MAKYHINPETGNANICTAKFQCKFTSDEGVEPPHYGSKQEAQKAAEEQLSSTLPTIQSLKNNVEIKEPVGDPRDLGVLSQDIRDLTAKEDDLLVLYRTGLNKFQRDLVNYEEIDSRSKSANTLELRMAYTQTVQNIRQISENRKMLMLTRARISEDQLIRDQKMNPERFADRAKVLESLNPHTHEGRKVLEKMKQLLEDSEKELAASRRATDNLVNRHENGLAGGSNSVKATFADINDRAEQSERMTKHARALKQLSNCAEDYESLEALYWRERKVGVLDVLHTSREENIVAGGYSPSQIETYTRIVQGQDQNVIDKKLIETLTRRRTRLAQEESEERSVINSQLRDLRSSVKYNSTQYDNSIGSTYTNGYNGFV